MSMRSALLSLLALVRSHARKSVRAGQQATRFSGDPQISNRYVQPRSFARPLLFIGQITALGPVFQAVCKSEVNQTVDFAISEVLLGDLSEDTFHYGYPNCS